MRVRDPSYIIILLYRQTRRKRKTASKLLNPGCKRIRMGGSRSMIFADCSSSTTARLVPFGRSRLLCGGGALCARRRLHVGVGPSLPASLRTTLTVHSSPSPSLPVMNGIFIIPTLLFFLFFLLFFFQKKNPIIRTSILRQYLMLGFRSLILSALNVCLVATRLVASYIDFLLLAMVLSYHLVYFFSLYVSGLL